jgi:hypothetical protein
MVTGNIELRTRFGTKVMFITFLDGYVQVSYLGRKARVLEEDFDEKSREKICELKALDKAVLL